MPPEITPLLLDVGRALLAGVIALPIGIERERAQRPAGLRTFPIVSLASCAFVVLATRAFPDSAPARARILQGLITGIGFGHIQIAIVLSLANYLVLRFIKPIAGVRDQTERARNQGEPEPDGE